MSLNLGLVFPEFRLRMDNSSGQKVYQFGDFRLNCGDRMLYREDDEINLSPKAIETLIALVDRSGQIVSKDELISAVWPDTAVEESNLFLYLSLLRKTLGTDEHGKPWIETLRRRGYRFSGDVQLTGDRNGNDVIAGYKAPAVLPELTPAFPPPELETRTSGTFEAIHEDRVEERRLTSRPFLLAAVGFLAAIAVIAFAYPYFGNDRKIDSIAVMPFVNETGDPENEFLADGIAEALIGSLTNVPELKVQARTTVFRLKGNELDARKIGNELNVPAVLLGHLSKSRSKDLELHVELIDTQTGSRIWAKSYDGRNTNLAAVERDVAPDLLRAMRVNVEPEADRKLRKNYTENIEAFALLVKGRTLVRKLTRADMRTGIGYLEKAIELDPSYAPAYAAISDAYRSLAMAGEIHPSEVAPKAKAAALKAVELDETLAEGHAALGTCYQWFELNHAEAEKHLLRAVELDPSSATVQHLHAHFLGLVGRREESAAKWKLARDLEPHDPFINAFGTSTRNIPDVNERVKSIRYAIELDPAFYFSHMLAAGIYTDAGMHEEALAEFALAKKLNPDQTWSESRHIGVLMKLNRQKEARAVFDDVLRRSEREWVPEFNLAAMYLKYGEKEKAFALLEKSYQIRDPRMAFLKIFSNGPFRDIREEPRFQELMRRVGY